jgi:hypothetical protein
MSKLGGIKKISNLKDIDEEEEEEDNDEQTNALFFTEKNLFFLSEDKEADYENRNHLSKQNSYYGQLKLFLELLSFILFWRDDTIEKLVYVGAMEGTNIAYIAKLFPSLHFDLYDKEQKGRKFDDELKKLKNVTVFNRYFEEKDIQMYLKENKNENKLLTHKTNIMFVSDIRSVDVDTKGSNVKETERIIWNDMILQQDWVEKLYPKVSSLKFRLPYVIPEEMDFVMKNGGLTRRYLDGKVMRQVFHGYTSSETRLIVQNLNYREWDLSSYEKKCAYHNYYFRRTKFYNIFDGSLNGYDTSNIYSHKHQMDVETADGLFDSTVLMFLVNKYLDSKNIKGNSEMCMKFVDNILLFLNKGKKIRIGRT